MIQQMLSGERKSLTSDPNTSIGKIDIGIQFFSKEIDIHSVVDIAIVCKSKSKGIYSIWYGNPTDEVGCICDETYKCNGSSWNEDDLRVSIDFDKIPSDIERMSIITNILWGKELKKHYGMMQKAFLHVYSHNEEKYILEQHINCFSHREKTGLIWGEIYPYKRTWKIRAIEESINSKDLGDLAKIAGGYL